MGSGRLNSGWILFSFSARFMLALVLLFAGASSLRSSQPHIYNIRVGKFNCMIVVVVCQ
jgi:hypothetical protein